MDAYRHDYLHVRRKTYINRYSCSSYWRVLQYSPAKIDVRWLILLYYITTLIFIVKNGKSPVMFLKNSKFILLYKRMNDYHSFSLFAYHLRTNDSILEVAQYSLAIPLDFVLKSMFDLWLLSWVNESARLPEDRLSGRRLKKSRTASQITFVSIIFSWWVNGLASSFPRPVEEACFASCLPHFLWPLGRTWRCL